MNLAVRIKFWVGSIPYYSLIYITDSNQWPENRDILAMLATEAMSNSDDEWLMVHRQPDMKDGNLVSIRLSSVTMLEVHSIDAVNEGE